MPFPLAGMPSFSLTDIANLRLQSISFFILILLLSTAAIRFLWNSLRKDFTRLPPLSYPRAFSLTALWGFLFVLVLSMISGARELLTPGAWEKQGYTYKLSATPPPGSSTFQLPTLEDRRAKLLALKLVLFDYASSHNGAFPASPSDPAIPPALWQSPDPSRAPYLYLPPPHPTPPNSTPLPSAPLVIEPSAFLPPRLVLTRSGEILSLRDHEIQAKVRQLSPPTPTSQPTP